ncbi:MAG TPA: TetR family transcriptional regulator [Polyangiales bacterium]|nr:TetR family transcriptional regulator [Polyangiales bacterium]
MPEQPSLRERKKAETRRTIAEVALRLFLERGFDAVTVADVAAAAAVSTKTVFNYFPTKEDLVLTDGDSLDAGLIQQIQQRAPNESVLDAVHTYTLALCQRMRSVPAERRQAFRTVLQNAPSVQAHWRERQRRHEAQLASVLATESRATPDDARPFVVAGVLSLLSRLAYYDVIGWPDGKRRSAAKTEEAIANAFALLGAGLSNYPGVSSRGTANKGKTSGSMK